MLKVIAERNTTRRELPLPVPPFLTERRKVPTEELRQVRKIWGQRLSYTITKLPPEKREAIDHLEKRARRYRGPVYVLDANAGPRLAAARLQWLAFQLDLTQKEIARRVGVSPVVINRIFKNPDRSTVATLRKIAKAMNVKLVELIND